MKDRTHTRITIAYILDKGNWLPYVDLITNQKKTPPVNRLILQIHKLQLLSSGFGVHILITFSLSTSIVYKKACKSILEVNNKITLSHPSKQGNKTDTISPSELNLGLHLLKQQKRLQEALLSYALSKGEETFLMNLIWFQLQKHICIVILFLLRYRCLPRAIYWSVRYEYSSPWDS